MKRLTSSTEEEEFVEVAAVLEGDGYGAVVVVVVVVVVVELLVLVVVAIVAERVTLLEGDVSSSTSCFSEPRFLELFILSRD